MTQPQPPGLPAAIGTGTASGIPAGVPPGPAEVALPRDRIDRAARARVTAATVLLLARWTRCLERELLGLSGLVGPGSVCIDIGSAAGLYTVALSRLAGPSGRVHSVEPLSFAHPAWTRVLRARNAPNVSHHAVALGAEPGSGEMSVPIGRHGPVTGRSFLARGSRGLGSNAEFADQITVAVPVDTLDGLCARAGLDRLDFIKVDVEGAELAVLEGGQHAISTYQPAILIEIEARHTKRYQYTPDDIVSWFTSRGYTMHTWQRRWQETSRVCAHTRNYLFRPPRPQRRHRPDDVPARAAGSR